jgi:hypothetical protein
MTAMAPSRSPSNPPMASSFHGPTFKTLPHEGPGDNITRTKVLFLGMRKYELLVSHQLLSFDFLNMQERKDIDTRGVVQQASSEAIVLSRDVHAHNETRIRVRHLTLSEYGCRRSLKRTPSYQHYYSPRNMGLSRNDDCGNSGSSSKPVRYHDLRHRHSGVSALEQATSCINSLFISTGSIWRPDCQAIELHHRSVPGEPRHQPRGICT